MQIFFNACFFDGKPKLNPDDLTEVDTDISSLLQFHGYAETVKRIVDVVKKSAYGVDFVILGIENQSKNPLCNAASTYAWRCIFLISKNITKLQKKYKRRKASWNTR